MDQLGAWWRGAFRWTFVWFRHRPQVRWQSRDSPIIGLTRHDPFRVRALYAFRVCADHYAPGHILDRRVPVQVGGRTELLSLLLRTTPISSGSLDEIYRQSSACWPCRKLF